MQSGSDGLLCRGEETYNVGNTIEYSFRKNVVKESMHLHSLEEAQS